MAEQPAEACQIADLIGAHVIAVDVGRDPVFFAPVATALDDALERLLEANEFRMLAERHRHLRYARADLRLRATAQRRVVLTLAAFVLERTHELRARTAHLEQAASEAAAAAKAILGRDDGADRTCS